VHPGGANRNAGGADIERRAELKVRLEMVTELHHLTGSPVSRLLGGHHTATTPVLATPSPWISPAVEIMTLR
jgi:hypothetical protein